MHSCTHIHNKHIHMYTLKPTDDCNSLEIIKEYIFINNKNNINIACSKIIEKLCSLTKLNFFYTVRNCKCEGLHSYSSIVLIYPYWIFIHPQAGFRAENALPLSTIWALSGSKFKAFWRSGVQCVWSVSEKFPFQRKWFHGFFSINSLYPCTKGHQNNSCKIWTNTHTHKI